MLQLEEATAKKQRKKPPAINRLAVRGQFCVCVKPISKSEVSPS
jgi:hypothetical protein